MPRPTALRSALICVGGLAATAVSLLAQTPAPEPAQDAIRLDPFTVTTDANEGYFSKSTSAFGRVVMNLENVPQKVEVYNAQFIADIIPTSISDITRYSSAVNYNNSERNDGGGSLVRGFSAAIRRNGENFGDHGGIAAVETIEQTEVVKGPSAVLYGASQPGGVINYVTKIPKFKRETTVTAQLHSLGGYTGMVDTTGPIGPAGRTDGPMAAYRFVVVDEDRSEYQDNSDFFKRRVFFGKILVRPTSWLSLTLEAEDNRLKAAFFNSQLPLQSEYTASRSAPYSATVPNPALVREPFYLPVSWTYQDNDTFRTDLGQIYQGTVTLDKDFGQAGRWALRSFYSLSQFDTVRNLVDIPNTAYPKPVTAADLGKVVNRDQTVSAADVAANRLWLAQRSLRLINDVGARSARNQVDLTGQFATGPVKHTFLAGTELSLGQKSRYALYGNGAPGGTTRYAYEGAVGSKWATWVDAPDYRGIPIDWSDIKTAANPTGAVRLQAPAASVPLDNIRFNVPWVSKKPTSYYFFDALSLLEDRLQISAGLRHDAVTQLYRDATSSIQKATASQWTKRVGTVYKIRPWIHVYALYNESFNPNATGALNAWQTALAPQDGKQKEAGVRLNLFADRLALDASYFDITNKNVYQSDPFGKLPTRFPAGTDLSAIPDTVLWPTTPGLENKGFDLDAKLRVTANTQLFASYTHNDMVATGTLTQALALGRPTYSVNNVPKNQFSLWSKWTPPTGWLRAFNFNLGYRYVGERPGGPVGNVAQINLSGYGLADAAIGYHYQRWTVNFTVRNVFDKYAFRLASGADRIYPEKPRHAILSVTTHF
ncbi:MAG: TonB-dependent receptor [Undibacterium sp.]|nr:TonB-dependent receptor [Opitutaceae bacterium]